MPTYRCRKPLLLTVRHAGGQVTSSMHEAGSLVEYEGHPGESLEPTCDEGRKRQAAWFAERERLRAEAAMNDSAQTRATVAALRQLFAAVGADEDDKPRRRRSVEAA